MDPTAKQSGGGAQPSPVGLPIRVVLLGRGRLGRFAAELLERTPDFEVVASYDSTHSSWPGELASLSPELAFEATVAGQGYLHARACLENGVRPVVATSGVTPSEFGRLDTLARERELGGFVVPNFSLGALLLERVARELAPHFPEATILETHRPEKRDAPSSTARHLADAIGQTTGVEPPIRSLRLTGHYAEHEIEFTAPGESFRVHHSMTDPSAFGPGILSTLRAARTISGMHLGLAAALLPNQPLSE